MSNDTLPCRAPTVLWAQDSNFVFLTVEILDVNEPKIDIKPKSILFDAVSTASNVHYQFKLNLFNEIDPQESSISDPLVSSRCWLIKLKKKDEKAEYWERLSEEKEKLHWLKIDWTRWQDEDTFSTDMPFGEMDEVNDYSDSSEDDGALPSSDSSDVEANLIQPETVDDQTESEAVEASLENGKMCKENVEEEKISGDVTLNECSN